MLISRLKVSTVNVHISNTLFRHLVVIDSRFLARLFTIACAACLSSLLALSVWREAYRRLKRNLMECSPVIGSFSVPGSWVLSGMGDEDWKTGQRFISQLERRSHE
jgi:hypothetical protein